jgi:hypothetical protein
MLCEDSQKVLHLPVPELLHSWIIGRTFNAAVPAVVAAKTTEIRSRFDRNSFFSYSDHGLSQAKGLLNCAEGEFSSSER